MILDGNLLFTGTSNGASGGITATANTDSVAQTTGTYVCSNVVDLGISGLPTSASGGGARDIGIGDNPMLKLFITTPVAMGSSGSATIQFELDGGVDNGSGSPTWGTIMWQSQAIAYNAVGAGMAIANVDVPRIVPGQALPRFLRVRFIVGGATISGGTVEASIVVDRFDQVVGTSGALSAYPPGIVISN